MLNYQTFAVQRRLGFAIVEALTGLCTGCLCLR